MDIYFQNIFPKISGSQEENQIIFWSSRIRGHANFATLTIICNINFYKHWYHTRVFGVITVGRSMPGASKFFIYDRDLRSFSVIGHLVHNYISHVMWF